MKGFAYIIQILWMAMFITIPLAFSRQIYEGAMIPKLAVFQALLIPILIFGVYRGTRPIVVNSLFLAIACYMSLQTFSVLQSTNAIEAILNLSQHVGFIFVPLLVISTLNSVQFNRIIQVAAWSSLPVALIGVAQYLGWDIYEIPSNAQPSATFYHRNAAAAYLICTIPLAWIGFHNAHTKRNTFIWTLLLAFQTIFLIFTRTRAAWIALLVASIMLFSFLRWQNIVHRSLHQTFKSKMFIGLISLVILAAFMPENIQGIRRQKFDEKKASAVTAVASIFTPEGNRGRFELWQHTATMIASHPLGVGIGNWQFQYPVYARGEHLNVKAAPERPHNDLLWIASELGIIGLFAFIAILINAAVLAKPLIAHKSSDIRTLALGLSAVVIAYLTDGLFSFPRGQIAPTFLFWFAIGGIALLHAETFYEGTKSSRSVYVLGVLVVSLALGVTIQRAKYDAYHLRVHTAERQQDWDTVIREAANAQTIGFYRANTFIAHGRALYRQGNFGPAQKAYEIGLRLHPNSLNAHNNIGIVHRRLGNPEKAVASFRAAIALFPNFVEAHYNLGLAYYDLAQYQDAMAMYQKALNLGLITPQVYFSIGRVFHKQGDLLKAQQHYLLALHHDANFAPAQRALAQMGITP